MHTSTMNRAISSGQLNQLFCSFEEAAVAMKKSRSFVLNLVRAGKLHAVRFNPRCHLIDKASLDAYLARRIVGSRRG